MSGRSWRKSAPRRSDGRAALERSRCRRPATRVSSADTSPLKMIRSASSRSPLPSHSPVTPAAPGFDCRNLGIIPEGGHPNSPASVSMHRASACMPPSASHTPSCSAWATSISVAGAWERRRAAIGGITAEQLPQSRIGEIIAKRRPERRKRFERPLVGEIGEPDARHQRQGARSFGRRYSLVSASQTSPHFAPRTGGTLLHSPGLKRTQSPLRSLRCSANRSRREPSLQPCRARRPARRSRMRLSSVAPAVANRRSNTQRMVSTVGPASTGLSPADTVRILPPGRCRTLDEGHIDTGSGCGDRRRQSSGAGAHDDQLLAPCHPRVVLHGSGPQTALTIQSGVSG